MEARSGKNMDLEWKSTRSARSFNLAEFFMTVGLRRALLGYHGNS